MKICIHCKIEKPLDKFSKRDKVKGTLRTDCKDCVYDRQKKRNSLVCPVIKIVKQKLYHKNNYKNKKHNILSNNRKWYNENKEKHKQLRQKWYNENKEIYNKGRKEYYQNNKALFRARDAKRRAMEIDATLNVQEFIEEIKNIYKDCPEGYHVDHIIPLNNDIVCGLHVPWNLQYLTKEENLKKGNRLKGVL